MKTPGPVNKKFPGLTTFRGNLTRSYYGEGPVPADPVVRWREPAQKMCSTSIVGLDSSEWCGTGWTGQPNVIENADGTVEVREGAYDGKYHFVDGTTGDADAAGPGHARPREGVGDVGPGRVSRSTTPARETTTSWWWRWTDRNPPCSGS